jgi:hypothetical protein
MSKPTELEVIGAYQLPDHTPYQMWLHSSILRGLPSAELSVLVGVFKALKLAKRRILSGYRSFEGLTACRTLKLFLPRE